MMANIYGSNHLLSCFRSLYSEIHSWWNIPPIFPIYIIWHVTPAIIIIWWWTAWTHCIITWHTATSFFAVAVECFMTLRTNQGKIWSAFCTNSIPQIATASCAMEVFTHFSTRFTIYNAKRIIYVFHHSGTPSQHESEPSMQCLHMQLCFLCGGLPFWCSQ